MENTQRTAEQEFLASLKGTIATIEVTDLETGEVIKTEVDPNLVEAPNNTRKFVQALYDIYVQMEPLSDMEKELKVKIKEAGLNAPVLAAVAKAKVQGKLSDLEEKSAEILNVIEKSE